MIFFIHIPKTAGTTFYHIVKSNFEWFIKPKIDNIDIDVLGSAIQKYNEVSIRLPGGYQDAPETLKTLIELNENTLKKIKFIGGHVGYGIHELINVNVDYISFVRHPKDRIVSDFFEQCKKGRHYYKQLEAKNFDINVYLNLLLKDNLDNLMTRQINGPYDFFLGTRKKLNEEQFRKALEHTEKISFYDITNFDEAILHLSNKYNWSKQKYTKKNITTKKNIQLQINEALLNEVIKYDLKLYEEITTLNKVKMSYLKKSLLKMKSKF